MGPWPSTLEYPLWGVQMGFLAAGCLRDVRRHRLHVLQRGALGRCAGESAAQGLWMELASEEKTEEKHSRVWQAKAKAADFVSATLPARTRAYVMCVCVIIGGRRFSYNRRWRRRLKGRSWRQRCTLLGLARLRAPAGGGRLVGEAFTRLGAQVGGGSAFLDGLQDFLLSYQASAPRQDDGDERFLEGVEKLIARARRQPGRAPELH